MFQIGSADLLSLRTNDAGVHAEGPKEELRPAANPELEKRGSALWGFIQKHLKSHGHDEHGQWKG